MIMITTMGMKVLSEDELPDLPYISMACFATTVTESSSSPQINQNTGRSSGGVGDGGEEMFIVEGEVMEEEVMEGEEMIMVTEVMMTVGEEMMCEEK